MRRAPLCFAPARQWALWLCVLLTLAACTPDLRVHSYESYVFGTRVEILIWGEHRQSEQAVGEIFQEFDRLHRRYHAWQPSPLTALNAALAAGKKASVDAECAGLLRQAKDFSARTEGLFDPGIGSLIALWGFHRDEAPVQLPELKAIESWRQHRPSIADMGIEGLSVSSRNSQVALDFGGILKGVALDRAAELLRRHQINHALINMGGNVMALGSKGDKPWRVGVQSPRSAAPMATLDLRDGEAIGTSGDYQRYMDIDGHRYGHVLDPRSGWPAQATQSLTVLIPPRPDGQTGAWSDWASKPLFIAGDDWKIWSARLGLTHVLRIAADGRMEITPDMRARVQLLNLQTAGSR
jgi:thiamine biosynthesis lipoprotein